MSQFDATRRGSSCPNCVKIHPRPHWGAHSAPSDLLAAFKGREGSGGKGGRGKEGKRGKREGKGEEGREEGKMNEGMRREISHFKMP